MRSTPKSLSGRVHGHLRAALRDGSVQEISQDHLRGGALAPLSAVDLERKFLDNAIYGGWSNEDIARACAWCARLFASGAIADCESFQH
jgi:hypothetical protein